MDKFWFSMSWLMKQGIEFLWHEWFLYLTIALSLNLIAALFISRPFRREIWKRSYFIVFPQILVYPLIAAVSVLGWSPGGAPPNRPEPNQLAYWTVIILNLFSLWCGIYPIFKLKGARWFAFSFFLFNQWTLQSINLMATMAIGGVWL